MANVTGRPIAPARKLVAAVMGTIAVFVMVFGLGMSSWAIVALGAALLALSIALGMVNVARRGARAWIAGQGQVKAISDPPASSAYGRAELQLVVVAPGLPITEVLVRDSRVPVGKWPRVGDTVPLTVDVDDMRRVRIDWDQAADHADDGDPPPPPPSYEPADEYPDDDLLGEPEPPPWAARDRQWGSGPDEPPPMSGLDDDDLDSPVVVHDTPAGPVLEGHLVEHDDNPRPPPLRARSAPFTAPDPEPAPDLEPALDPEPAPATAPGPEPATASAGPIPGQARPPGTRPRPRPHAATATATADPETHPAGTTTDSPEAQPAPADRKAHVVPEQRAGGVPGSTGPRTDVPPPTQQYDPEIDLPLEGDPEPAPEYSAAAATAVASGLIAAPADDRPVAATSADTTRTDDRRADPTPADTTPADTTPDDAADPPTISGLDTPAGPDGPAHEDVNYSTAATSGTDSDAGAHAVTRSEAAAASDAPGAHAVTKDQAAALADEADRAAPPTDDDDEGQDGPWAGLEGGYEPDERADDLITAYPSARPGPAGAIHGVGITVLVTDLDRSVAFYRDTLGFFEIDSGSGSAVLASGDTRLVLRTVQTLSSDMGRLIYLNLEVGDVEAVYEEIKSKGITFEHGPRAVNRGDKLELWAATFHDPDGHNIAVTQWRAVR